MSVWSSTARNGYARNLVLVTLMFAALEVAARAEGYAAHRTLPFLLVLGVGAIFSVWLSMRVSTARLLGLLTFVFLMEYVNQSIGIASGLWVYHGKGGQYVFGVMAWLVAACSAQMMALGIAIPILRRLHLPALHRLNVIIVAAFFSLIPLTAGPYRPGMGIAFWAFYGLAFLVALLLARRMRLEVLVGVLLAGVVVGNLSEYAGSIPSGYWSFPHNRRYPPLFLVLGCWPLEILVQFGMAAFFAGERVGDDLAPPIPAESQAPCSPETAPAHGKVSRAGRHLRIVLVLSGLTYLAVGFAFAIVPNPILGVINALSRWLFPHLPLATLPDDRFWVSLSFSMMMTITALCWIAALNVRRNRGYVFPLLIAKLASAASSLVYFVWVTHHLASLVIVLVDGGLFALTLFFFVRAQRAFFRQQTGFLYDHLPPPRSSGPATVVVEHAEAGKKFECLDRVLAKTHFFDVLERAWQRSGKSRDTFRVVIKPNFMFMHSKLDRSTYTDPELVLHLANAVAGRGFTDITVVESQTTYGNYYLGRDVLSVAEYLGYTTQGPYRIVDLTKEMVPYDYHGRLGMHVVGPTWRDADFRISFAKNKTHVFCNYTLTLKNIYGTLPMQDKLCEYHTKREYDWPTIETLKHFKVHFGLIDGLVSGDGQFGVIADPNPNPTNVILGGDNLLAVDWAGAKKMGLDPDDPLIGRFLPLAQRAFGKPEVECNDLSVYRHWSNVSPIFTYSLDILEEAYAFSNWWFSVLTAHDKRFPFKKKAWPTLLVRKLLAPIRYLWFPHDAL